jgi:hypothetical protein
VSALLFSVLTTRLHALSVTLRVDGQATVSATPFTATGVASKGELLLTPEKASMTPDHVLSAVPVHVYAAGSFEAILYQMPWFNEGRRARVQPFGPVNVPGQSVTEATSRSPF